jgi:hypothetical protein
MKTLSANDDPTMRCAPPLFPRRDAGAPVQIIQRPGFAFVFTEAYPVYRIIPTTGRAHTAPQYLFPTYMGDSTARWEGDTLVVDVISFNGEGWLASALDKPTSASTGVWLTSDALHVVERWRRVDADTLEYQARVEDPKDTDDAVGDFCDHLQTAGSREDRRGPVPPGGMARYLSRPPGIVNSLPNGKPQLRFLREACMAWKGVGVLTALLGLVLTASLSAIIRGDV